MKLYRPYIIAMCCLGMAATPAIAEANRPIPHQMTGQNDTRYVLHRALLWNHGDDGSKFYRIPAIVTANDGTLVAVADKRIDSNSDLPGRIDVVCRTSSDNGLTWTPSVTVKANDEGGGYGDPALTVDRRTGNLVCIMTHGNGLWQSTPDDHAIVMVSHSSDNGATWSKPADISHDLFSTDAASDAPIKGVSLFATSGHALQTSKGRIIFAAVVRPTEKKWQPLSVQAIYSDDGGHTWQASPQTVDTDGDESKIVELPDGKLLMSIRNRRQTARRFATSTDGGITWSAPTEAESLRDPACNGDIIPYTAADGRKLLLHSLPGDQKQRRNVSIFASDDNGASWTRLMTVCPTGSAYSAMTIAADGTLGCITEEQAHEGGLRLWYTAIDIERLIAERFPASR